MDGSFAFYFTDAFEEDFVTFWAERRHDSPGFSAFSFAVLSFQARNDPGITTMTVIFVFMIRVFGHAWSS